MSHNFDKIIKSSEIQFIQVDNLCTVLSHSVMSDSLLPHGLQPARLLCSWGFSRQDYCSGLPCSPPGNLPNSEIKPREKKKKKKKINFLGKTTQVLRDLRKYVCQNNTGDVNNDIPLTFVTQFLKTPNPQSRSEKKKKMTCNIDILKIIFMVGWQWFICFACQCSPAFFFKL